MKIEEIVFTFPSGSKINLDEIISIGDIDKDFNTHTIFIPVVCRGFNKAIHFTIGNSAGKVPDDLKANMLAIYKSFVSSWENFLLVKMIKQYENGI